MEKPLVSIIIPVYNGSNYLKQSIDSALGQTYKNIEIIVVNDGSSDNGETEGIALSYGDKIRYFYKKNGGVSSALNYGIKQMRGDLFSWLSHDDLYHEEKIEKQVNKMIEFQNNMIVIFSNSELIDEKGNKITKTNKKTNSTYTGNQMFKKLLTGFNLNGCALLIPKEALVKAGYFDEKYKYIQDWKMWLLIASMNYTFIHVNERLVKTRIHKTQQSRLISKLLPIETEEFINELLDEQSKDIESNSERIGAILYNAARINNRSIKDRSKEILISSNKFTIYNRLMYSMYIPVARISSSLKICFRWYLDKKRKSN